MVYFIREEQLKRKLQKLKAMQSEEFEENSSFGFLVNGEYFLDILEESEDYIFDDDIEFEELNSKAN